MKEDNDKNAVGLRVLCGESKGGEPDAVILANGEYPSHAVPLEVLQKAQYVVCCDGGANAYIAHGNIPDAIIGDGDSLSEENHRQYRHILHSISEQETNDQTKAVNYLLAQGKKNIAIVGATGKREDHTLGNISLLIDYMRAGAKVRIFTDHCIIVPCRNTCTFSCQPGTQISIINFGARGLRGEGLLYPLSDFTNWWQGTLNECTKNECTIHAEGEYLVMINFKF
ncbi:thiamine diphosphokinase [Bacteroides sp. UBA939]|uniref:thiamine diphosphokinase n=1 Tax=Bacteroides sp. UBA939 TaxID=1946092 RepID=UPI0025C4FE56|nr:thiamine diphosphokinase [Bacteroides sp. UBA939]